MGMEHADAGWAEAHIPHAQAPIVVHPRGTADETTSAIMRTLVKLGLRRLPALFAFR